jgi:hypothetical protein
MTADQSKATFAIELSIVDDMGVDYMTYDTIQDEGVARPRTASAVVRVLGLVLLVGGVLGCRPPYSPRSAPDLMDGKALGPDVFEDQYAESGPPKLVVGPAFDIEPFGQGAINAAVEVHANVPTVLAVTGYAGYGLMGGSAWQVEGYAGFPLFKGSAYTLGNWALSQTATTTSVTTTYKKVNIPVHTMFIIEGGFRLQGIHFASGPMDSDPPDADNAYSASTLGYLRAGLRRKTFWHVKSGAETARSMSSWWLHAILQPVGIPDPDAAGEQIFYQGGPFGSGESETLPVGGAFGMEFPAWLTSGFMFRTEFAYVPGPHRWELNIGMNYLFNVI